MTHVPFRTQESQLKFEPLEPFCFEVHDMIQVVERAAAKIKVKFTKRLRCLWTIFVFFMKTDRPWDTAEYYARQYL